MRDSKWAEPQYNSSSTTTSVLKESNFNSEAPSTISTEDDYNRFREHQTKVYDPFKNSFETQKAKMTSSRAHTPEPRIIASQPVVRQSLPTQRPTTGRYSGFKGASGYENELGLLSDPDRSTQSRSPSPSVLGAPSPTRSIPTENPVAKSRWAQTHAPVARRSGSVALSAPMSEISVPLTVTSSIGLPSVEEFEPLNNSRRDSKIDLSSRQSVENSPEADAINEDDLVCARLTQMEDRFGAPAVVFAIDRLYSRGMAKELPSAFKSYVEDAALRIPQLFSFGQTTSTEGIHRDSELDNVSEQVLTDQDIEEAMESKFKNVKLDIDEDALLSIHGLLAPQTAAAGLPPPPISTLDLNSSLSISAPALSMKLENGVLNGTSSSSSSGMRNIDSEPSMFSRETVSLDGVSPESFSPDLEQAREETRKGGAYGPTTGAQGEGILADWTVFGGPWFLAGLSCAIPVYGEKYKEVVAKLKKP